MSLLDGRRVTVEYRFKKVHGRKQLLALSIRKAKIAGAKVQACGRYADSKGEDKNLATRAVEPGGRAPRN